MGSSSGWFAHRRRRWRVVPALLLGGWLGLALPEAAGALDNAAPRVVTPRGELLAQEKATVDIFERSKGSVVFISTQEQVVDFWTRNVFSVPSGSGSGFIWDAAGHVITNFHVIQGATAARVKLADGRDYRATLVGRCGCCDRRQAGRFGRRPVRAVGRLQGRRHDPHGRRAGKRQGRAFGRTAVGRVMRAANRWRAGRSAIGVLARRRAFSCLRRLNPASTPRGGLAGWRFKGAWLLRARHTQLASVLPDISSERATAAMPCHRRSPA